MKLKWYVFGNKKPKVSGFYFTKRFNRVDLFYYSAPLDRWLYFEGGCFEYLYMLPGYFIEDMQWAKLVGIPKSKMVYRGYIDLDFD